ncbi:MAG: glycosyltransferase [Chloroflexi bacterium]|nr:glycosyltransferase [Chloroflexota bacterium]MCC6894975.1 glycosyltransferase [Anaerolineae bacterium]
MRVVHLMKVVGIAGAERHLITLLGGLRENGIDARIIVLVTPDKPMQDYIQALGERGIPAETIVIRHHADVRLIQRLRDKLLELKPDILHTHLIHADLYGTLAARWAGVPVVISSRHNDDAFRYRKPVRLFNRWLWGKTDAGIAISDAIARFSIAVEGAKPEQIQRVHYGIDISQAPRDRTAAKRSLQAELKLPLDSIFVGMVCRLIEQKGVRYGLEAFTGIANEYPAAHLLVVGDGLQRAELEAQAKAAGMMGRIHFLGWRKDAAALMAGLDILLAPSLWEGFGLVLLEAMAQQTAIISSDVSAIPEVVIHRETGILLPPRDVEGLKAALRELLKDAALRQHMGMMGRDRLESTFNAARMVKETIAFYHTVTDGI